MDGILAAFHTFVVCAWWSAGLEPRRRVRARPHLILITHLQADERAADEVTELLNRLAVCDNQKEQRIRAAEWVEGLKEKLQLEGRRPDVLDALQRAGDSLSRG